MEKYLPYYDAVLLENHGALTWSTDLLAAYMKMESVEFYAELLVQGQDAGRTEGVRSGYGSEAV